MAGKKERKKDAVKTLRVNQENWQQAEVILDALGINISSAITMFIRYIILRGGLPFPVTLPEGWEEEISLSARQQKVPSSEPEEDETGIGMPAETIIQEKKNLSLQEEPEVNTNQTIFAEKEVGNEKDYLIKEEKFQKKENNDRMWGNLTDIEYENSHDMSDLESFEAYYQEFLEKTQMQEREPISVPMRGTEEVTENTSSQLKEILVEQEVAKEHELEQPFGDFFSMSLK